MDYVRAACEPTQPGVVDTKKHRAAKIRTARTPVPISAATAESNYGGAPRSHKGPSPHYGSAASSFVCSFRPHVRLSLEGKGHKNSPKLTGRLFMQRVTKIPIRRSKGQRSRLPGLLHYSDTFGCGKATVRGTSSYIQQLFRTIYKMHRAWQSVTTCSRKNTINSI